MALALRLLYLGMAQVDYPIRGDINQYVLYAWNLSRHDTFSAAMPDAEQVVPDSYRGPGYPAFLALTMRLAGTTDLPLRPIEGGLAVLGRPSDTWMTLAFAAQVLLGAATVWLVVMFARLWLPSAWALAAGLLTALWPHLIVFSGTLLSETLFGFLLLLSLWLLVRAVSAGGKAGHAVAGVVWGLTYLVNPVVALFPVVAAGLIARRTWAGALVFLAAFLALPVAWSVRNITMDAGGGALHRIEQNFIEGSWPQYHAAYSDRFDNDIARSVMTAIDRETEDLNASASAGLRSVLDRFALDPGFYLRWYVLEKPYLLWDWGIRIGAGDIYYLPTQHSPFDRIPLLAFVRAACRTLNPLLFALAALTAFASIVLTRSRSRSRTPAPLPLLLLSLLALYLTAVHVVLQAEPRYSIPYRPQEILLAVTAGAWIVAALSRRLPVRPGAARPPDSPPP